MLSAPQYSISSQSNDLLTWQKYLDYISISQNWSWKEAEEKNVCIDLFNGWLTVNHLLIIFVKSLAVFLCFLPHFLRGLREIADLLDSMAFLLLSWNMKNSVQLSQPTQKAFHELVRNRTIHLNIVPDNNQLLWMWCSGWWRAIKRFPEMMIGVNLGQELYCKNKECNLNYFSLSTRFSPNFSLQLSPARHCIV